MTAERLLARLDRYLVAVFVLGLVCLFLIGGLSYSISKTTDVQSKARTLEARSLNLAQAFRAEVLAQRASCEQGNVRRVTRGQTEAFILVTLTDISKVVALDTTNMKLRRYFNSLFPKLRSELAQETTLSAPEDCVTDFPLPKTEGL